MSNKKVIVPGKASVLLVPGVEGLLGDAMRVIEIELTRYHHRLNKGDSLTAEQARTLQGYIRSLVELSKEARERAANQADDLSKMSDEQLLELVQSMLAAKTNAKTPQNSGMA